MNEKHTPGPWHLRLHQDGVSVVRPGAIQEEVTIYPAADARLIATAPEILAALREAEAALRDVAQATDELMTEFLSKKRAADWGIINVGFVRGERAQNAARAAIAKAEG